jgi:formylglycine-generating enzyme required for sulfatase activity
LENHWDISKIWDSGSLPVTIVSPIDGAEMVLVPEGEFTMGISQEEFNQISLLDQRKNPVYASETPARTVHLKSYYIDRYPLQHTSEVGIFDQGISPYGCYDMCGNVWEMCTGQWLEGTLPMRGGCFLGSATFVRVTCRWTPEDTINGAHWLGFRCIKEISVTAQ